MWFNWLSIEPKGFGYFTFPLKAICVIDQTHNNPGSRLGLTTVIGDYLQCMMKVKGKLKKDNSVSHSYNSEDWQSQRMHNIIDLCEFPEIRWNTDTPNSD